MKHISKSFLLVITLFMALPALSQEDIVIFKKDKPDIKLLWSRMADFSPTLRSVEAAEFLPTVNMWFLLLNLVPTSCYGGWPMDTCTGKR